MATPSAVLSILVSADTASATAKLTKFDRQVKAANDVARRGINARLGADFNPEGFNRYQAALDKASSRAKNRAAFKAELGANFNNTAFNQYQRATEKANISAKETTASHEKLTRSAGKMSSSLMNVAATAAGATFGIAALGKASLDTSTKFQEAMTLVHTQAGYAEKDVQRLSKSVLNLAPRVGFGPTELANSLYHVASAGIPAAKAMEVVGAAAKGARVGNADLEKTTNALVGILRTAPKDIKGAGDAMGVLSAIVGQGNMRMNDLVGAISTGVLPSAKSFGLGMKDVGAALDVMTSRGVPAQAAATRLRMTFSLMGAPTHKAAGALSEIGLSSTQLATDMRKPQGLVTTLMDLKKHLDDSGMSAVQQSQIISAAFGGGRTSAGLLLLLQNIDDLKKHTDALGQETGTKQLDDAFKTTQRDTAANMARLSATFQTMGVTIGNALAPVLPKLVTLAQDVGKFVTQMRSGQGAGGQFADAIKTAFGTIKGVVTTVVGAVGGLGNAIKIALIAFSAVKVYEFVNALKALKIAVSTSPVGAFLTVVGLLASAFVVLSGRQRSAAETARDVADAWNTARDSADALAQSGLQVVQARLNVIRTTEALTQAEKDVTKAQDEHGKKSPQYRQAEENLAQAKIDSKQASLDLKTATQQQTEAQQKSTDDTKTAISTSRGQVEQDKARIKSLQTQILALGHQGGQLGQIHQKEGELSDATKQLTTDQNNLNKAINSMPSARLSTIDLNVDFKSNMAGAIAAIAKSIGGTPLSKKPAFATHFTGGLVTQPGYFAGEEAPQHPEVILATNPAYRQRNLGLFAQAGKMLGVPGFLSGGITPRAGQEVSGAPPWAQKTAGAWMKGSASSWAQDAMKKAMSSFGGGFGGGLPVSTGGSVANWLTQAMSIVGVGGPGWLAMLERQVSRESGGNPNAINLTDVNAARGDPSRGLLQTIGSTFQQYALPGHGNIYNPVDNSIAAIRYMIATYGHGDPARALAVMTARGGGAYRKGGIHGIPGYAQGGFVADPGTNFSVGEEPTIVSRLSALAQSIGATIYGISGYRTPAHSVAVGGSATDPHTRGAAADIGVGSQLRASAAQLSAAQLAKFGLDRPFDESGAPGNTEVNHIQLRVGGPTKGVTVAKGIAKKAKKFIPSKVPKLSLPRNLANVPSGATPTITALLGKLNAIIDPNSGSAAALSDRISATSAIDDQRISEYQTANPNTDASTGLIAYTDPVTGATTHTIDQVFVNMRVAELQQLMDWQGKLRNQLKDSVRRIADLLSKLAVQIATRREYIKKVRNQILGNIAIINALTKYEKTPKLTRRQKSDIAAEITALKKQDTQLGGDATKVGSGGILGRVQGEIDSMNQTVSTLQDNRLTILGASGIGGTLGAANLDFRSFADQLNVFSPASTQAALAAAAAGDAANAGAGVGAGDTTAAAPAGPDPALLQQLLDQAHLATSVAEQQLSVLQATPPFGGSFAQGGVVPGPLGVPRTIIAHGGEAVGTPGDTHVHVHVADGMGWLRQFISTEVGQSTRRDARNASRSLPGAKGRY